LFLSCIDNILSSSSPQLSFKKWGFPDQNQVFDFAPAGKDFSSLRVIYSIEIMSVGLITDNRFDQFCVASMTGGYQAQVFEYFLNFIN
jgi:hypothetical protein